MAESVVAIPVAAEPSEPGAVVMPFEPAAGPDDTLAVTLVPAAAVVACDIAGAAVIGESAVASVAVEVRIVVAVLTVDAGEELVAVAA